MTEAEESPASTMRVAPTYTELSRQGTVTSRAFTKASPILKKATKTLASRKLLLASADAVGLEAKRGLQTMLELKTRFRTVTNPAVVDGEATHQWNNGGPVKADDVVAMCDMVIPILLKDATLVNVSSPSFIFGDLHGNYKDLKHFAKAAFPLGIQLATSQVVFLGDYVDRGPHSVECALHLLCLKAVAPNKVTLLRGNHEDPEVNGDEEAYGEGSFRRKCTDAYGLGQGVRVWEAFNRAFAAMPLCALVDEQVFCVHGGLPRKMEELGDILETIRSLPRPLDVQGPLISDLLWNDPVHDEQERKSLSKDNSNADYPKFFGPNARGEDCATFGKDAVDYFMEKTGVSFIIRAHEKNSVGFGADAGGKVLTVFSSSHYGGSDNQACIILIQDGQLHVIVTKRE